MNEVNDSRINRISIVSILKSRKIYIISATIIFYALTNLINYSYCLEFEYKFPPVDIIPILKKAPEIPTSSYSVIADRTFNYSNELLVDLLMDIFVRKEAGYLKSMNTSTIIVEPYIKWSPKSMKLLLKEAYFNLSTNTITFSDIDITYMLHMDIGKYWDYFDIAYNKKSASFIRAHKYISQFVYVLFQNVSLKPKVYNIDTLTKCFHLLKIGNLLVMSSTFVSLCCILIIDFCKLQNRISHYSIIAVLVLTYLTSSFFQIYNAAVATIIDIKFTTLRELFVILFYILQLIVYSIVFLVHLKMFKNGLIFKEDDPDDSVSTFQGTRKEVEDDLQEISVIKNSSQTSSIYSDLKSISLNEFDF